MNSLQTSLEEIKKQIDEALHLDFNNDGIVETKLKLYRKYISIIKETFIILDADLKFNLQYNEPNPIQSIKENHINTLCTVQNCVERSMSQLLNDNCNDNYPDHRCSVTRMSLVNNISKNKNSRFMPPVYLLDRVLAEKPANPMDTAKIDIQKFVNLTNRLLKAPNLTVAERATIQLRISRKIEETMTIARQHELQLCKTNTNNLEQLYKRIDDDIKQYRFLTINPGFPDLYKNSQLFYHHLLKDSKIYLLIKSQKFPEVACLNFILKLNDSHPVVLFLKKTIENLLNCPFTKELKDDFIQKIKAFNETIENLSKLCYLIINTNENENINHIYPKFQKVLLEFVYTNPNFSTFVYNFLFNVYDEELKQYDKNVQFIESSDDYNILLPEKFKSETEILSILDSYTSELKDLRKFYNPLQKMEKLCQIITDLMSKIHNQNSKLEIGADELVPILVFMVIKFKSPEIVLHGRYLELLMPCDYFDGMEGYILVSVICAITFCISDKFEFHISKCTD